MNKINNIDFIGQISNLASTYNFIVKAKNFLDDNRVEFRRAVRGIEHDDENYHAISASVKEAEKHLLISCYTISEQMMKETKYQLLSFDELETNRVQQFFNYKLNPEKFSPNPKSDEINKFFKRYGSSKLFLSNLKLYDKMIKSRHKYAHKGDYQFDISDIPKLINILLYLEFEYRMFLIESPWCSFFSKINTIVSEGGNQETKQQKFESIRLELINLIPSIKNILSNSDNILKNLEFVFDELSDMTSFNDVIQKFDCYRSEVESQISS